MTAQSKLLPCIEINPPNPATGSVIWMHGLGADGNDFAPIVPQLNLWPTKPIRFVFPNAPLRPITINNGYIMPGWYDITSLTKIEGHIDTAGIDASVAEINQLIAREISRGIPASKIVLAGFSQGALIALTAGLRYEEKLGGILALSGYCPFTGEELKAKSSAKNHSTPIFIGHGQQDTVVPYFLGQMAHDVLKKEGYPVEFHSYPMTHTLILEEVHDIANWLKNIF